MKLKKNNNENLNLKEEHESTLRKEISKKSFLDNSKPNSINKNKRKKKIISLKVKKIILKKNNIFKIKKKQLIETKAFKGNSINKKKSKIQKRLININNSNKSLKNKKNLIQFSYFSRFILRKKQQYRFFFWKNKDLNNEATILQGLKESFKNQEIKKKIRSNKRVKRQEIKKLSERSFLSGILYLKYMRSNFFANLIWENSSAKGSSGEKFKGPKKKTMHARESVLHKMSYILGQQNISTLDIQIVPFGKVYIHLLRIFFRNTDIYIRYLLTPRKRSHGFTRPAKIRRT